MVNMWIRETEFETGLLIEVRMKREKPEPKHQLMCECCLGREKAIGVAHLDAARCGHGWAGCV